MDETQAVTQDDVQETIESAALVVAEETDTSPVEGVNVDSLQKQIADLRKEAAKYRTKVREFEKQQVEAQAELERKKPLEEKLASYEEKVNQLQAERDALEARTVASQVRTDLLEAGVARDLLDDAFALYVSSVTDAEEGSEPDIAEFLKARPYLVAKKQVAAAMQGANPAGKTVATATTRADIANMTPEQYAKERSRLFGLMSRGGIR